MNPRRNVASVAFAVHAVATAALGLLSATDYWQVPLWIWFFLSVWLAAAVYHESATPRLRGVASCLGLGLSLAWMGVLCVETRLPPPAGFDETWHILVVGWPVQLVARLWQDPTGLVIMWGPRRFGYDRLFEWDASYAWFVVNVVACCAIACLAWRFVRARAEGWLPICAIWAGALLTLVGTHFLHWTRPLVVH